jgi:DNA-binding NtrC family response regulator
MEQMNKSLLIIEKEDYLNKLVNGLAEQGTLDIMTVHDLSQASQILQEFHSVDGAVLDYSLLKDQIRETIKEIKSFNEDTFIILVGHARTDELVSCIKYGADEFIDIPVREKGLLKQTILNYFHRKELEQSEHLQKELEKLIRPENKLIGSSPSIMQLKRLIYKIAPLDSTVLILGETGTGKEVVARMIHSLSPQRNHNFVAVHCGGIPDTLLESTLFGHEKGSFTGAYKTHKGYFESAGKGTILLDEIGDTTPSFQVKLLRVLQEKEFRRIGGTDILRSNARILAATNRDLSKMVKEGTFREDLYYRLNVITLRVAALRERREDIPLLIRHFVNSFSKKHNNLGVYLKPETIDILLKQHWKGNVRELENVIERLVALAESDWISPSDLPQECLQTQDITHISDIHTLPYAEAKNIFEKEYIRSLLKRTQGNISQAAKLAGMPRQNLHLKIKKHSIRPKAPAYTLRRSSVTENV